MLNTTYNDYIRKCEQKRTLSKLLRRRVLFTPRSADTVLALSAEESGTAVDRREPRFLKGTVEVLAVVKALSAVDNEWHLFVSILLLLPIFVGLKCL